MWLGHVTIGLIFSAIFNFDIRITLTCLFFSLLPNFDVILVKIGGAKKEFHCGPTHSIVFSLIIGIFYIFSPQYGLLAFLCYFFHLLFDLPTKRGISFLYPFTEKRFTFNLWKETGFWGYKSILKYYKQKWAIILEGFILLILIFIITAKIFLKILF